MPMHRTDVVSSERQASDDGQQWTRFEFDSSQLSDGDDAAKLDLKELPDNDAARVDASHEASGMLTRTTGLVVVVLSHSGRHHHQYLELTNH